MYSLEFIKSDWLYIERIFLGRGLKKVLKNQRKYCVRLVLYIRRERGEVKKTVRAIWVVIASRHASKRKEKNGAVWSPSLFGDVCCVLKRSTPPSSKPLCIPCCKHVQHGPQPQDNFLGVLIKKWPATASPSDRGYSYLVALVSQSLELQLVLRL